MSAPAHLEHRFTEPGEDGVRLHYVARGEGRPIVFMHGFPQFWFLWRNQLADLGDDHAVFAPDLRGYNLSDKPQEVEAYRMRKLLGDLGNLIEQEDLGPFTLVGHDWGGIVSWAFALKHPELLERFVIIDSPPPFTWNRDLRESKRQREAVNYMLELSKPSPEPERMLEANDFAMLDAEDPRAAHRGPDAGDLGRARPRPAARPHPRARGVDPRPAPRRPPRGRALGPLRAARGGQPADPGVHCGMTAGLPAG